MGLRRRRSEPKPAPIPPSLAALLGRQEALQDELDEAGEFIGDEVLRLVSENRSKINEYSLSHRPAEPFEEDELKLGPHECSGPLGLCVYDDTHDPRHDTCLFCSQPRERK